MSTHSLRKKLLRSRPEATKGQRSMRKIRKFAPWVAAICVGAYLPPKVMSSMWKFDADGNWNSPLVVGPPMIPSNWTNDIVPNNNGQAAEFVLNFTANRTISLVGPPPISPIVGLVRFDDLSPSSTLTILGDNTTKLLVKATTGNLATFDVSKGNTLQISSSAVTNEVLGTTGDSSGINKVGFGLLSINGTSGYTGPTTLTQGVLVANTIGKGGNNPSSLGKSLRDASNLVFNGGVLRYVAPIATTAVTDRSFTLGPGGATIDSSSASGTAALVFGTTFTGTGLTPAAQTADGPGTTIVSGSGDRLLTLRGTSTAQNEIQATINDFGNPSGDPTGFHTTLQKLDTGFWKLSALLLPATSTGNEGVAYTAVYNAANPATWLGNLDYGNKYTGDTIVQRGTLQVVFPLLPTVQVGTSTFQYSTGVTDANRHFGIINPKSTLKMGSAPGSGLPGGGTFEVASGVVQRLQYTDPQLTSKQLVSYSGAIQDFERIVINSGANTFNRVNGPSGSASTNTAYIYVPDGNNITHNAGGTLNLKQDGVLKIGNVLPLYVNGVINGWMHRDDNWVVPVATDVVSPSNTISPNYASPQSLNANTTYRTADDQNGASVITSNSNVLQNALFTSVLSNGSSSTPGNQRFINSLKFDVNLPTTSPNKQFRISNADDPTQADFGLQPTTLAIANGGLLAASGNGITQILGGRLTSGSGDFKFDVTDPQNPRLINLGGGTVGQSEIFAIIRSAADKPLYVSSAIVDYYSRDDTSVTISVGLTKSGPGTMILLDATSTGLTGAAKSRYQGDTYINEGALVVRADSALGATIDYFDIYQDPDTGADTLPNAGADGTHGQTYLLGSTAILDFQAVRYTLPEKVNVFQGEIQASIGRSTFKGVINNLNEEEKTILRVGTYLELLGDVSTDGRALYGQGGFRKLGAGVLLVQGDTKIGTHIENGVEVINASEFPGSADLTLEAGSSAWNGSIDITNGSIVVTAGPTSYSSFNGPITINNGVLVNTNSLVAFTKAGQNFTVELQQTGASAQTLFGNLNQTEAEGAQVYTGPITVGTVTGVTSNPGGALAILGSIDFGTSGTSNPINLIRGTLSQAAVVNGGYIPTTRFYGPVTFGLGGPAGAASTITLNHNTLFNESLTVGQTGVTPQIVNIVTNGIGHTTFNGAVNIVNGSLTLTDTSFTLPYTHAASSLTLNGFDTFNRNGSTAALTITGGTFAETGTRRAAGVFGVRDNFIGAAGADAISIAPTAALPTTLALTFSGNNNVQGNISVIGNALLPGVTSQRADVTFANAQTLTGNLVLTGGQVTLASSGALGTGSSTPGVLGGVGGILMQGEKSVLNFLRGTATAAGEDITLGTSSKAYLSGIAVSVFGTGYSAGATITVTGGNGTLQATGTPILSGSTLLSVAVTGVGAGYDSAPSFSQSSGGGSVVPVFGGPVIRGQDQNNVINGAIILNNNVASGKVNLGTPLLSVGQDDTLQITGDIFGSGTIGAQSTQLYPANGGLASGQLLGRFMTTALLGGGSLNSGGGILILSGQVKDVASGAVAPPSGGTLFSNMLNFEIAGSNDLNVQVEKPWNSSGLVQLAQGVVRYTNTAANATFFQTGANAPTPNFALSVPNTVFGHTSVGFNSVAGNGIQSAALFLTQAGQTFNANGFSVYMGNSNKLSLTGLSTGYVVVGGENTTGTVTYGTHLGNITLDASDSLSSAALRDLRLYANSGGTVDVQHAFVRNGVAGTISIDKVGDGTVWLSGSGTSLTSQVGTASVLDRVYALGGTLELRNFGQYSASRLGASNTQLYLGGGTLRLFTGAATGSLAATGAITQTLAGIVSIRNGLSSVQVVSGANASTLALGSAGGSVSRSIGGAVRFAVQGSTAVITLDGSSGIGSPRSGVTAVRTPLFWASYGTNADPTSSAAATHFAFSELRDATTNANVIMPYLSSTASDNLGSFTAGTQNIEEGGSGFTGQLGANYGTVNLVRFHSTAAPGKGNLDLGNQNITLVGAIMLASNAQGANRTISNGNLTASSSNDIVLQNWGGDGVTVPRLIVSANLVNNGLNDNPLTVVGDGTTQLTGAGNSFRGSVYVSGGVLEVASAAPLGSNSTNASIFKNLFLDGGTLHTTGDFTWDTRNIVVYGDRSTIQIDAGKTFTLIGNALAGGINSQSSEIIDANQVAYGAAAQNVPVSGSANIFNGDLVFAGPGTFVQVRDNVANQIAGQVVINGGGRLAFEGNNFGFLGNNLSWMDGTTVVSGSTLELRPTTNSIGALTVGEFLHLSGAGQAANVPLGLPAAGGALVMKRPEAAANAAAALTDRLLSWTGPVTMDGNTTIFVDDKPEITVAGVVGQLTMDGNIVDGGASILTKAGDGILRFNNTRIQNLSSIVISKGEVRFENGILGTVGSEANKTANGLLHTGAGLAPSQSFNNYTTGTNSITVGSGATNAFATGARLAFVDVRGTHSTDIALNNGFLFVQSADAPLQATSFAGDFTLTGTSAANAIEATYTNRVNPVVMFGAFNGTGGFTKFGNNEIDFVNPNSGFTGEILVARGGGSITSPGVGLYDGGRFTGVSSIRLTNDGSFFVDNQNSLNGSTGAAINNNFRINDNAALHLGGASRFRLLGNDTVATSEALGVLNVHLGSSAVTMDPSYSLQNIGLSFNNYTRDAGGTVSFRVLKTGVDFGTGADEFGSPLSTKAATIQLRNDISPAYFKGGGGIDPADGFSPDPQSTSVVVGAFGGSSVRNYATLPTNTSLPLALNNNDEPFNARNMMTVQSVDDFNGNTTRFLRPLKDSEYLTASTTSLPFLKTVIIGSTPVSTVVTKSIGIKATDTFDFTAVYTLGIPIDPNDLTAGYYPGTTFGTNKNVRLIGKIGPSSSAIAETLFATQGFYTFDQRDDSRRQDSLYRVLANVQFNSLTFAQQTNEIVDGAGNRIILEISPDKVLTIGSGMILHAGLGVISAAAPNVAFNSTQAALIRGGTLNFGATEGIIMNVAAGLNETTGVFSSFRQTGSSPFANLNIGASDLTISSSITGSAGLTKSGPSTVNLSGVNDYSGTTTVAEGILRLENSQALGRSSLVVVAGTGELRMQRGITVGDMANPHALKVQFNSVAQPSVFRSEAGNNAFYGDVQVNTLNAAGDRFVTAANPYDVSIVNGTGASLTLGGDFYGLDTAGGAISPLNDVQRGRQSRIVNFNNAATNGGVIQLRGSFRDLQSGSVSTFVQSDNEEQVLRAAITGASNSNLNVYSTWDAAGSILLRQGALHFMSGATDFFSKNASNAINPFNAQAHPTIGDQANLVGDVFLGLTTGGQVFNSPTLQIINNGFTPVVNGVPGTTTYSNVTIGGENTTGTVKFFAPSLSSPVSEQFNNAALRVSTWERNVRLYAAAGGTVEIAGRITDNVAVVAANNNNGSITKVGLGTVILTGMDGSTAGYVNGVSNLLDFDKGINIAAGKLILNANVSSNTTVANIFGVASTPFSVSGGKLEILGDTDAGVAALETWNGTFTIRSGASEISLSPVANGGTITLTLGANGSATTRSAGGTVNFTTPGSTGVISYLSTSGVGGTGAMLAPWATYGSLPGIATDFAATSNNATRSIVPVTGYTTQVDANAFLSGQFANEGTTGFTNDPNKPLQNSVKLIRFQAPSVASTLYIRAQGVSLGNGNATSAFDEGAILVPTGTNALKTIAVVPAAPALASELQVNGGKELYIFNYGTGGLNITAPIIGASSVVLSGPGTTTLGRNRQTGNFYLNEGVTSVDKLNYQPLTIGITASGAGQLEFAIPAGANIEDYRTGSTVTTAAGVSLGTIQQIKNGSLGNGGTFVVATVPALGTTSLTITPAANVNIGFNLAGVTNGTAGTLAANQSGVAVGAAVSGAGVPVGTYVTAINGTAISFSQSLSNAQALTFAVPNGLGMASSASTGLNMNGGTLQYTGPTVQTDRNVAIADNGATFDVTQAASTLQIGTLVTTVTLGGPTGNPNGGGLTKLGLGTLVVSGAAGANTYTGRTDVRGGMLSFQNATISGIAAGPFGSSTNLLDGTIVRSGGIVRAQFAADLTTQEWFTFRGGSGFDIAPQNANRTLTMDGVIDVTGASSFSFTGANAGSATLALNTNAGYLSGSGSINKGTVNNGLGGVLVINESSPEYRGGFSIEGGRMIIKSVGNPTGTGAAGVPINLGTAQINDLSSSTSKGSPDARIIFQMRDLVNANGGTTLTGAFDSFQVNVGIPQDIIVNRPSDAVPGAASSQIKQIGVIGTGLSLDQYNLNGALRLRDDLQFYVEDTFTNVNAGEEFVNFNINGPIITEGVDYTPTFTSKLSITGRPSGALPGIYNNLYVAVSLNHANPNFVGNLVFGNTPGTDEFGFPTDNPDANHILRLNNDGALNSTNKVILKNNVTLQVQGHNVTMGSLIDDNAFGAQTQFSGGSTTGYIVSGTSSAIVENGSSFAATLTINQTEDNDWRFTIRDGVTADGARTASLGIIKTGPATVRITNANDFSGGLKVLDGTVLVRNSGQGSATGIGKVDVIGAAFGGDNVGRIAGDLTITNSNRQGVLTPGRITPEGITLGDTLYVSKLTFQSTNGGHQRVEFDTYSDELGGSNDRVDTTSLDINSPVQLVLRLHAGEGNDTFGHIFTPGDPIDLDGEFIRLFTSLQHHIAFNNGGYFYYGNQILSDGSDIQGFYLDANGDPTSVGFIMRFSISNDDIRLTAVPEPNVALTLAAGVGALLGLQRFRRRGRAA